ncbi:MAG: hypothetical protein ACWA5K_03005 [bacterium]
MPLSASELRHWVIEETVESLQCPDLQLSPEENLSVQNLLLGTAAQESGMGTELRACRRLGIYHISPAMHKSVWDNHLINFPELASRIRGLAGQRSFLANPHGELLSNLKYATAIALSIYHRAGQDWPTHDSPLALAVFWHRHFHPKASGSTRDFLRNYRRLVHPQLANAA